MVGPESEKTALVRHAGRMFVVGANIDVPLMTIVIRKAYGLGAQAMAGGSFKAPLFTVTWPTGGVRRHGPGKAPRSLAFARICRPSTTRGNARPPTKRSLRACTKEARRSTRRRVFELDDAIDPADSRKWITAGLRSVAAALPAQPQETAQRRYLVTPPGCGCVTSGHAVQALFADKACVHTMSLPHGSETRHPAGGSGSSVLRDLREHLREPLEHGLQVCCLSNERRAELQGIAAPAHVETPLPTF